MRIKSAINSIFSDFTNSPSIWTIFSWFSWFSWFSCKLCTFNIKFIHMRKIFLWLITTYPCFLRCQLFCNHSYHCFLKYFFNQFFNIFILIYFVKSLLPIQIRCFWNPMASWITASLNSTWSSWIILDSIPAVGSKYLSLKLEAFLNRHFPGEVIYFLFRVALLLD